MLCSNRIIRLTGSKVYNDMLMCLCTRDGFNTLLLIVLVPFSVMLDVFTSPSYDNVNQYR
jgi:hypothetical protein